MRNRRNRRSDNSSNQLLHKIKIVLIILIVILLIVFLQNFIMKSNLQNQSTSMNFTDTNTYSNATNTNKDANSIEEQNPENENSNNIQPEEEKDKTFTMAVTGDIMCHNTMYTDAYNSSTGEYDFAYMFEDIKYYLQTADITIGNLETTFAGKEIGYSSYPTFNTPETLAKNLKKIGFDVLSTANNHCIDKGYTGIENTIKTLDNADISHTGTFTSKEAQETILIKNVKGVNIAFLSFTYGTNGIPIPKGKEYCVNLINKDLILKQLELAKEQNPDLICVSMHWGTEYQTTPNSTQKELADLLFENGADIILGNHPHVIQPMEKKTITLENGETKEGFIIYSLGNFMADQKYQYTRDTAIVNLTITQNAQTGKISIDSATYTPVYIYKNTSVSKKKFKLLDIESTIEAYKAGVNTSIGKSTYNTLVTELKNIKNLLGKEF